MQRRNSLWAKCRIAGLAFTLLNGVYDTNAGGKIGVDLNFSNTFALDGGMRYLKTFSLPQQLGDDSETVHPRYFQVYIGIGLSFRSIGKKAFG